MAANVETMFYVREVPWHGLGTNVDEALTSDRALVMAGLDWTVEREPLYTNLTAESDFNSLDPIDGFVANVRSSDKSVLGVVSEKYKVVQNRDAFAFTDALIASGDVRYETAGSLANGRKVWMLGKINSQSKILGDDVDQYLLFSNAHDGSGAIRIAVTPIRVVCQNTLNLALAGANRSWSTKHMGDMSLKMQEAERTLNMSKKYMELLAQEADALSQYTLKAGEIEMILDAMFPIAEDATKRTTENREQCKDEILQLVSASDLQKFGKNNAWGFINGVTDWAAHRTPLRQTSGYAENNFDRVTAGHPVLDQAYSLVKALVKAA